VLFAKKVAAPKCDQAPCGTGMHYLAPTYKRTVSDPYPCTHSSVQWLPRRTLTRSCLCRLTLCTARSSELLKAMTSVPTRSLSATFPSYSRVFGSLLPSATHAHCVFDYVRALFWHLLADILKLSRFLDRSSARTPSSMLPKWLPTASTKC
jgi:hypothetical protein